MADRQAMRVQVADRRLTAPLVSVDDEHRTGTFRGMMLKGEVDRRHGAMATTLKGHAMYCTEVGVNDVPPSRL
tara:strand:- start:209 stop:427 length:219 start_codon:yes stop_codon:yes gene_type:complete